MNRDLMIEVTKLVGNKKVAKEAIKFFLEAAKKDDKVRGWKVAIAVVVAVLNFSALAVAASAPAVSDTAWNKTLAAAKKEGRVSILGPEGIRARDALTLPFQKKYPEIEVDLQGMDAAKIGPKLLPELAAGRNSTDLVIAGTTTMLVSLLPANALVPVKPFLSGPNTQDQSKWLGGRLKFADNAGTYNLVFSQYVKPPFVYNTKQLSGADFKSWRDLLDPKWQGKIEMKDPRMAGGGLANATMWYVTESLGKDFIRKFLTQKDLMIMRDDGQMLDFCAQGKYQISVGVGDVPANEYINKGLPLKHLSPESLKEGTYVTAGNGSMAIPRNVPHPNALRVYVDFLLSQEGQLAWSKAAAFASLRRDVPRDHVQNILVPKEGVSYLELSSEKYVLMKDEIAAFIRTILPR